MLAAVPVCHLLIIFGISGDLARKMILPSIWMMYNRDLLPPETYVVGFARSDLTVDKLKERVNPYVRLNNKTNERAKYDEFWKNKVTYVRGRSTDKLEDVKLLDDQLKVIESKYQTCNRMYYLALPPSLYANVTKSIRTVAMAEKGWTRLAIEKPFGSDLESSNELSNHISSLFNEDQIYRMDHFLGKETVQNILALRFSNYLFESIWDRNNIEAVEVLFKESFGSYGRGGYFDKYGIIRDVVQNHLLQIMVMAAMEEPLSLSPEDVRNAKVNLLKDVKTLDAKHVVLGQYVASKQAKKGSDGSFGYTDDPTVPKNSTTSTYFLNILEVNNKRWRGVPFIIRGGKALDEDRIELKIYFKSRPNIFSPNDFSDDPPNVLVIRIEPNPEIYLQMRIKDPNQDDISLVKTKMNMLYNRSFRSTYIPDAYERLLMDVMHGNQANFVRTDELQEAWRIFTPALHQIDAGVIKPFKYTFGSKTVPQADALLRKLGYVCLIN